MSTIKRGDTVAITESCMSVDDFENPKLYKDAEAVAVLLTRIILLEPGTIQSHPDAGVGIMSKFRFSTEGSASELRARIQEQIETFLPRFRGAKINVQEKDGEFHITAEIDDTLYGIYYNINTHKISYAYTNLSNL